MFESETLWLTVTNVALGAVTIICLFVVGRIAVREIGERVRARAAVLSRADDHAFVFSDLGITMADGGEALDERTIRKGQNGKKNSGEPQNN